MGIASLPVQLGVQGAARLASIVMAISQIAVIVLLTMWGRFTYAAVITLLLAIQIALMVRFLKNPIERATWYSALGVTLYVIGMLVSAFAIRSLIGAES